MTTDTRAEAIDLRLTLITSGTDHHTVRTAAAAAAAGAGVVQVRAKEASARELLDLVERVAAAVSAVAPNTRVVVDDRADVAIAARRRGAAVHGVHLGQDDLPVAEARDMLGPGALIGLTTGTLDLVEQAQRHLGVVDYLGAGPFRPTPTKDSGRAPLGLGGYPELVRASRLPVLAIGDVRTEDVAALSATGIAGVVMVREIMGSPDPAGTVGRALAAWDQGRRRTPSRE